MFVQQDWLMRQIEMMVSAILRLFFGDRSQDSALREELSQGGAEELRENLIALLHAGQLGKAEDLLFEHLDGENKSTLAVAADFYRRANALSDEELEAQDFTREELLEGLGEAVKRCGLFLPGLWDSPSNP